MSLHRDNCKSSKTNNDLKSVLQDIISDCMWDCNIGTPEIERLLSEGDERRLKWLFEKIIYNSKNPVKALKIFSEEQLKRLFDGFIIPSYNRDYLKRRFLVLRYIFLGEKAEIRGLAWKI